MIEKSLKSKICIQRIIGVKTNTGKIIAIIVAIIGKPLKIVWRQGIVNDGLEVGTFWSWEFRIFIDHPLCVLGCNAHTGRKMT